VVGAQQRQQARVARVLLNHLHLYQKL
jgi:hypothetical protein